MQAIVKFKPGVKSLIAHELRTPLTAILGNCFLLNQTSLTKVQKDFLNNILESAHELLTAEERIYAFVKKPKNKPEIQKTYYGSDKVQNPLGGR